MAIDSWGNTFWDFIVDIWITRHINNLLFVLLSDSRECKGLLLSLSLVIWDRLNAHHSNVALLNTSMTLTWGSLSSHLLLHDSKDTNNFNSISRSDNISQLSINSHQKCSWHLTCWNQLRCFLKLKCLLIHELTFFWNDTIWIKWTLLLVKSRVGLPALSRCYCSAEAELDFAHYFMSTILALPCDTSGFDIGSTGCSDDTRNNDQLAD